MAKRGRPAVPGVSVYVRLDPDLAEKLNKFIDERKHGPGTISKNSVINYALRKFFFMLEEGLLDDVDK